jgi:hypothetical protein
METQAEIRRHFRHRVRQTFLERLETLESAGKEPTGHEARRLFRAIAAMACDHYLFAQALIMDRVTRVPQMVNLASGEMITIIGLRSGLDYAACLERIHEEQAQRQPRPD